MKAGLIALFACGLTIFSYGSVVAAEAGYPSRPIEITVGYSPGAGTDLGTRIIAEKAKKYLNGQDIVCVNKPGGGGRVALTLVSKMKADGYSLGASTDSAVILSPNLEKVPYRPIDDFTFITRFGILDFGVIVMANSPFKTFKDMMDFAQANPDKLTISTVGEGTTNHVGFQAINLMKGLKIKLVPFSGAAPAMTALLGGHVMVASTASSGYAPYLKSKTVRLLAMMGDERLSEYPDVPTLKELGYPVEFQSWYIFTGPKNLDKSIVAKLSDAFEKAMETPEYIKLGKELEIYTNKPLHGDQLRAGLVERGRKNAELFKKLGMGIK